MSILVSWTFDSAGPLLRGWVPNGLSQSDFERGYETVSPGLYYSRYKGDPATIGNFGMSLFIQPLPVQQYRTRLKPGEIIALLKDPALPDKGSYAKIFRAAYPQGNKPEDDTALEFLEQAKRPISDDGLIDVTDLEPGLDYFVNENYMDVGDKDRVIQGWPV